MTWRRAVVLGLLGLATGVLSGLLGVGGGIVMVPALVALGLERHVANATSLAAIFVVALAGAGAFAFSGALDPKLGLVVGVGGVIGATFGANWASRVSADSLARIFAVVLFVVGIRMLVGFTPPTGDDAGSLTPVLFAVAVGIAAGLLSGVAGVGGGIIIVPSLVMGAGLDQHTAEGTSLFAILFTAAAGTRVNVAKGYLRWGEVAVLAAGGVVTAGLAGLVANQIAPVVLARVFGVWLVLVGARTLWTARPRGPAIPDDR